MKRLGKSKKSPEEIDKDFMRKAIKLAEGGVKRNEGGPFGAIVVKDGAIVGTGNNRVIGTNDPTSHAEIVAIRNACKNLKTFDLTGCVIYTTCEPCPMCLGAIYWARIKEIIYACGRDEAAKIGFSDEDMYKEFRMPLNERKIPLKKVLRDEAFKVFQLWDEKPDKTLY
jgi:tRNA(Arg) A34 adenosine deaminase TadA